MQPTFSVWPLVAGQLVKVGTWLAILGEEVGSGYVHVYMPQSMTRLVVAKTAVTSSEHLPVPQDFDVLPYVIAKGALTHENDELRVCYAEANRNLELVQAEYESIERQLFAQSDYSNEIEYTLKLAQDNHATEISELILHHERERRTEGTDHCNDPLETAKSKFRDVFHDLWTLSPPPNAVWLFTSCSLR